LLQMTRCLVFNLVFRFLYMSSRWVTFLFLWLSGNIGGVFHAMIVKKRCSYALDSGKCNLKRGLGHIASRTNSCMKRFTWITTYAGRTLMGTAAQSRQPLFLYPIYLIQTRPLMCNHLYQLWFLSFPKTEQEQRV
jgi:hypothetical protein